MHAVVLTQDLRSALKKKFDIVERFFRFSIKHADKNVQRLYKNLDKNFHGKLQL